MPRFIIFNIKNLHKGVFDIENLINIYKIINKKNNYIYVGSTTKTLQERFKDHCKKSKLNYNPNSLFYKDMIELGEDNFEISLLDTCLERHRYIIEEYWYSKLFQEHHLMYDIKQGTKHSLNTRQRLSFVRNLHEKAIYNNDNFKDKMSQKTSGENNGMFDRKNESAINGRIVIAYTDKEHLNLFQEFCSVKTALQFIGIKGHHQLLEACRNNTIYHGYYWVKEWIDR